jgi:hypothetical protein
MRYLMLRVRRLIDPKAWISRMARSDLAQW